ncbi:hypothetical protein F5Y17DRAFT_389602 [Xylariaceae sp. FL0594]|nr:hypothetical protein F5Y17DRAFT_389602 [Xylariaceae sp. FL0594]
MPVTNLVWLTSSSETFTEENKAAMAAAFDAQADWVARNAHSPAASNRTREDRGVSLLQQVDDPRVVMETAHWSSSEEHGAWLASEEYRNSSAPLASHFDFSKLEYFHLDVDVFSRPTGADKESLEEEPLLTSSVIGVGRVRIPADQRGQFSEAWESGKGILEAFVKPRVLRYGFRVQKPDLETDEFVFFVGWPSVEKHREFAQSPNFADWAGPLQAIAKGLDLKYYRRVL